MRLEAEIEELRYQPSGGHGLAALVAFIISAMLHFWFLSVDPPLPVGRSIAAAEERPRIDKPMRVERFSVPETHPPISPGDRLRPQEPGKMLDTGESLELFRQAIDASLLDPPQWHPPAMAGAHAPLERPPARRPRMTWSPRQKVLQIQQQLVKDKVSALPRRFSRPVPRVAQAPDLSPPVELALAELPSWIAGEPGGSLPIRTSGAGRPGRQTAERAVEKPELDEPVVPIDEEAQESFKPLDGMLEVELSAYREPGEQSLYFRLAVNRGSADILPPLPRDIVFVQDSSESMSGRKLSACRTGLRDWVDQLGERDNFNLLAFREGVERCFGRPVPANAAMRARAHWFIDQMSARGRTDVFASLKPLLDWGGESERPLIAILLTDGEPTAGFLDSFDIIERFTSLNAGRVSVFPVMGGSGVNRFLLDLIGYKNRGDAAIGDKERDIPALLRRMALELSRPVLTDLDIRFVAIGNESVYPRSLPHLYLDRPLVLYGRVPADHRDLAFRITGRAGRDRYDVVFHEDLEEAAAGGRELRREWARRRLYAKIGEYVRSRDASLLDSMLVLARNYDLDLPYRVELGLSRD